MGRGVYDAARSERSETLTGLKLECGEISLEGLIYVQEDSYVRKVSSTSCGANRSTEGPRYICNTLCNAMCV
jgi:hypothetical protein